MWANASFLKSLLAVQQFVAVVKQELVSVVKANPRRCVEFIDVERFKLNPCFWVMRLIRRS